MQYDNLSAALGQVLRPEAASRWMLPYLSQITPQYIENVLRGAMAGSHVQAWELFDLMCDTDPEIASCVGEYCDGILKKKIIFEPYHEENEQPSATALQKCKVVSAALRNMRPDPSRDENNLTRTIRDLLFSRFHGQSVLEMDWFDAYGSGQINTVDVAGVGKIAAPRSTFWVHPVCYAWSVEGSLGLRVESNEIRPASKSAARNKQSNLPQLNINYFQSRPTGLQPFPANKFLINIFKAKTGSPLSGSALRPLAWWWCASNFCGDWLLNLAQLFGIPFRKGKFAAGTGAETIASIRAMLQNCGSAGYILLPDGADVEFIEGGGGTQQSPQAFLFEFADRQKRKVILRQTMTGSGQSSSGKGGLSGMQVEDETKVDCLQAGANHACESLEQMGQMVLAVNYGETSEAPTVRLMQESEGGLPDAQRDQTLAAAGLKIGVNYLRKKYSIPEPTKDEETIGGTVIPSPSPVTPGKEDLTRIQDDAEAAKKIAKEKALEAGDSPGHEFHGNQWTDETLAAETKPLRRRLMIGDEVVFANDGKAQRGYLSFKKDSGDEVDHAEIADHPTRKNVKWLARTGEKSVVPTEKLRMPKDGFTHREFQSQSANAALAVEAAQTDIPKSSTQLTLSPADAQPLIRFAKSIPDKEIFHADEHGEEFGIETEPHITVLFGLTQHAPEPVRKVIAGKGVVTVTLGKISVFENEKYDVLKIDVEGNKLRELNTAISGLPNEQNFPEYHPHLTLAYLNKGEGKKYDGDARFEGTELTFHTVTFSPPKILRPFIGKPELSLEASDNSRPGPASKKYFAAVAAETLAPLVNRLKAILAVEDPVTQKELLEKFLKDEEPKIRAAILHDASLSKSLEPDIVKAFFGGLEKTKATALAAGDADGHDFHGNQYVTMADENWSGTSKEMHKRADGIMRGFTTAINPELGEVRFTKQGRSKTLFDKRTPHEFQSVQALPQLIARGKVVSSENDRSGRQDVLGFHKIEHGLQIGETKYRAEVTIKKVSDGAMVHKNFYLHRIKNEA